ncbi:AbrB/MazE/SpoVT family DNA-binding domain-containing protein [Candidatus Woesearchaeota archaeon]|nr:AbrB/MazE/SpoVT family DNA-binding domain-containing protein [Candidatus Woesearchaeota archaeon]
MIVQISKGRQLTIPAEIREDFGLDTGSKIELIKEKGRLILKPIEEDIDKLFEEAKKIKPKHNFNVGEMEELNEGEFR